MARMLAPTELLAQSPSRLARKRLQHASGEDQLKAIPLAELARACMADQDVYIGRHRWWRWRRDGVPNWLLHFMRLNNLSGY